LEVKIVLAIHRLSHSAASLEVVSRGERRLSARAAMMSIATLSALAWAAVLLPLWAVT
jgi:hypothetical protein